jgi:hypothetical protein
VLMPSRGKPHRSSVSSWYLRLVSMVVAMSSMVSHHLLR